MTNHRDTLFVEEAEILLHEHYAGDQHLLRLHAPAIAVKARAGSFVHVTCDATRPLRRPISLLRVDTKAGWVELMYKVFGDGTRLLSARTVGEKLSVLGPIGVPFTVAPEVRRPLLIGGGIGMPPMLYLADELRRRGGAAPFVILGSEVPFPFQARPSTFLVPGIPADVTAAMPLLEDWGIASRLCSGQGYAGCHQGYVTDLARRWLDAIGPDARREVALFACGPHPMLEAVAALAREFTLPCQVSMEEFMACGVGGCAGCTIEVQTDQGPAMKRVCVDGPVFDARAVFAG
jgi:dihydroorotate dehydrogenase electron transfer subunit